MIGVILNVCSCFFRGDELKPPSRKGCLQHFKLFRVGTCTSWVCNLERWSYTESFKHHQPWIMIKYGLLWAFLAPNRCCPQLIMYLNSRGSTWMYPLLVTNNLLLNMAISGCSMIYKMVIFHTYVSHYQRVNLHFPKVFLGFSHGRGLVDGLEPWFEKPPGGDLQERQSGDYPQWPRFGDARGRSFVGGNVCDMYTVYIYICI